MSDERLSKMRQLLARMQDGERSALDWLLILSCEVVRERAEQLLLKKFRQLQQRGHDVDSVVSDIWLKLKRHFDHKLPNSLEHLLGILALSVHHLLLDKASFLRRKDQRSQSLSHDSAAPISAAEISRDSLDPQELAQFTEFQEHLWNRLEELPQDQRRVFEMHYFLGITQADIADDLQLHPRQVSRLWIKASGAVVREFQRD